MCRRVLCSLICLCRLQVYTDVHGHITNLDKEVCKTNVCYLSFRFFKHRTLIRDNTHLLCKPPFPDLWWCGEQPHANSYSFYVKSHLCCNQTTTNAFSFQQLQLHHLLLDGTVSDHEAIAPMLVCTDVGLRVPRYVYYLYKTNQKEKNQHWSTEPNPLPQEIPPGVSLYPLKETEARAW